MFRSLRDRRSFWTLHLWEWSSWGGHLGSRWEFECVEGDSLLILLEEGLGHIGEDERVDLAHFIREEVDLVLHEGHVVVSLKNDRIHHISSKLKLPLELLRAELINLDLRHPEESGLWEFQSS